MSTYHNLADIQSKILIVDDSPEARLLMETLLRKDCYSLFFASNGEDAIEKAKEIVPDLILLDVMMPKVSGFDVLDILRNTPETANLKIIMLTALSQDSDKQRAETLGVDDYLVKSQVVIADVIDRIRHHLNNV